MNKLILKASRVALTLGIASTAFAQQATSPAVKPVLDEAASDVAAVAATGEAKPAAPAAQNEAAPSAHSTAIAQVVVTAQRRKENLQNAPLSVAVIGGEELAARNVTAIDDALRGIPGVALQGNANGAAIYIRGIGSGQDQATGGPAVNLNVDGLYQHQPNIPLSALYDIERVEVLRGPQGTLYGRNATAGSINIITANPTNRSEAAGSIGIGNFGLLHTEAMVNAPISDTVAVRASMVSARRTGYIHPSGYDDADTIGGRIKALFTPNTDVRLTLGSEYLSIGGVGPGAVDPLATHPDDAWKSSAPTGVIDIKAWRLYGQLDWNLGFATLTVLPAHQKFSNYVANVVVNLPLATTAAANVIKERQDTLEVRLASASDAALKWVAGLYYLDSSDETPPFAASRIALPATATTFPWYSGNKTSSAAAFGQLTFPITTWLRVTGGARYTQDKKTAYDLPTATTTRAFDGSWNSSTFKAGVEADLSASSMLYGNVSTGFKAGGIVKDGGSTGFATYLPEKLTAFTLGSKNRFRQNSVQLNAEAYYYDYKDFQAAYGYRCQNAIACPSISTFSNTIVNAGKATLYGGELEAVARITPDDRVDLNLAYSHTLFDSLVIRPGTANNIPAGCATTLTCTVLADQVLTNQHMANAPLWTVSLAYQHVWTMPGGGDLTMRADSRFSTSYWTLYRRPPQTPAESFQDAFVKSNAYLSYSPENGKWGLRLWVKNISNKAVVTSAVGPALTMQAPRTFGTTFSAKF